MTDTMMNQTTYICAEPDTVQAFVDNKGGMHASREDAIEASFRNDSRAAMNNLISRRPRLHGAPVVALQELIQSFIQEYPDMARVMIGDRDAT